MKRDYRNDVDCLRKRLAQASLQLKETVAELKRKTGGVDVLDVVPVSMPPSESTMESIVKHSVNIREGPTKAVKAKKEKQEATVAAVPRRSKRAAAGATKSKK